MQILVFYFHFMKKDKLETSEVIAEIVFKIIMFLLVAGILILMFNELFTWSMRYQPRWGSWLSSYNNNSFGYFWWVLMQLFLLVVCTLSLFRSSEQLSTSQKSIREIVIAIVILGIPVLLFFLFYVWPNI